MNAIKVLTYTHQELLEFDQEHAYTAISNNTMTHILSNRVIAPAIRLWLLIRFEQSGFKDRETVERPISWFAKKLSVSPSTIQKWQRLLEREGYLVIKEQKRKRKENLPNLYRATIPKSIRLSDKRRKRDNSVYTKFTSSISPSVESSSDSQGSNSEPESSAADNHNPSKKVNNSHNIETTQQKLTPLTTEEQALITEYFESKREKEQNTVFDWFCSSLNGYTYQKLSNTGHFWITGVNQFAIKLFKQHKEALFKHFKKHNFKISCLNFNRDSCELETNTYPITCQAHEENQIEVNKRPKETNSVVKQPIKMNKINPHTFNRIRKRLENTTINGSSLSPQLALDLTCQICFAIESGSLAQYPTVKAVNIGIKLVRENRWRVPNGYPQEGI